MAPALVRCAKCNARKFESEVVWSISHKDYICRNEAWCSKQHTQLGKVKKKGNYTDYAKQTGKVNNRAHK